MEEDTYLCPGCDREVRVGSRGCPYCNPPAKRQRRKQRPKATAKRARKSWEEDSTYDALDLPDEDFDYDDFVAREFGHKPHRKVGIRWYWWVTAIVLLVLIVLAGFQLDVWGINVWRWLK
jgi:hypothetical protein